MGKVDRREFLRQAAYPRGVRLALAGTSGVIFSRKVWRRAIRITTASFCGRVGRDLAESQRRIRRAIFMELKLVTRVSHARDLSGPLSTRSAKPPRVATLIAVRSAHSNRRPRRLYC